MDAPPLLDIPTQRRRDGPSLLIVDDNDDIRLLLRHQLRRRPHLRVIGEARNGREAVRECQTLQPDVVILDIEMPGGSGLDALAPIREVSPSTRVIMYSARDDSRTRETARLLGAADFVTKGGGRHGLLIALDRLEPIWPAQRPSRSVETTVALRTGTLEGW